MSFIADGLYATNPNNIPSTSVMKQLAMSSELEVDFDPEVVGSRLLVDGIERGSTGKFKLHVMNPYARMTSKDVEETSTMFRLFISSLFLSVSILRYAYGFNYFIYPSFFLSFSEMLFCYVTWKLDLLHSYSSLDDSMKTS